MSKQCFIHPSNGCGEFCMAYSGKNDEGEPRCLLLSLGAQFVSILRRVQEPETRTKHPRSAPPPEVR